MCRAVFVGTVEEITAAMELVAAALGGDQDLAAGQSVFGAEVVAQHAHFGDVIDDRRDGQSDVRRTDVVVYTVNGVHALLIGGPVDDDSRSDGALPGLIRAVGAVHAADARNNRQQRLEVAPVEHDVLDFFGGDGAAGFSAFGLHNLGVGFHADGDGLAADGELHIQSAALAGIEVDVLDLLALESDLCCGDRVIARRQRLRVVEPGAIAGLGLRQAGGLIGDGHLDCGHDCSRWRQ